MGTSPSDDTVPASQPWASPDTVAATPAPGAARIVEQPGSVLGPYRLVRVLGEGGFGVVYLAEQDQPVRRQVALKIIKLGMDTREVIARFEAERQALALMDHPGIATVLDAGTTATGRPYFVMERVDGVPITQFCDTHRLPVAQRLDLFTQVCNAVQHAHQKGVIHRDIKPSNVLVTRVDGVPLPKIIDFGIAKATQQRLTERTLFTELGQFIGTPAYMSPEQADPIGEDIDTRSDVYSLGVLLYELLTGTTPFDVRTLRAAALTEVQRIIREDEPHRPSTRLSSLGQGLADVSSQRSIEPRRLTAALRGDLDWIIMKALAKERNRRYDSASGLAADLRCYLANEPVSAGPPSAAYRFQKFVRRNRMALSGVVGVGVALGISVLALAYGLTEARRERDAKDRALVETQRERDAKESALDEASTQAAIAEEVNRFLTKDLLAFASPLKSGNPQMTVREALDRAARVLPDRFRDRPRVAAELEATVGLAYGELTEYALAEEHGRRALDMMTAERGALARETLELRQAFGQLDYLRGRYREGAADMAALLADATTACGADDRLTFETQVLLAQHRAGLRELHEAETLLHTAIAGLTRVSGAEHEATLGARNALGILYLDQQRFDDAITELQATIAVLERVRGPQDFSTLMARSNLLLAYTEVDRSADGVTLGEPLVRDCRAVLGDEHHMTLTALNNLANAYVRTGENERALDLRLIDYEASLRRLGPDNPDTLVSLHNLGRNYYRLGRYDEAEPLLAQAVERHRALMPLTPGMAFSMMSYGECLIGMERYADAIPQLEGAYPRLFLFTGGDHAGLQRIAECLVTAYDATGDEANAAKWRKKLEAE